MLRRCPAIQYRSPAGSAAGPGTAPTGRSEAPSLSRRDLALAVGPRAGSRVLLEQIPIGWNHLVG